MTVLRFYSLLLLSATSGKVHAFNLPGNQDWPQIYSTDGKKQNIFSPFQGILTSLDMAKGMNKNDEPEPKIMVKQKPRSEETSNGTGWESFKDSIYKSFDVIGNSFASKNEDTSGDLGNRRAPLEYSNTVGKTSTPPSLLSNLTPAQKLLRKAQSTNTYDENVKVYIDDKGDDDLYRSDSRKKFDSVKGGIYNSLDFISRSSRKSNKNKSSDLLISDYNRIKPMARASFNKRKGLNDPDLRERMKNIRRKEAIEETKESLYTAIDNIQAFGKAVVGIPEKVSQTVDATQDVLASTSMKVKDTIEEVQAFPGKVNNFVGDVRDSVEETKRITEEVSQDIKNIPKVVEENISNTQKSFREKQEDVRNAVKKAEDAVYKFQVSVGLEKPKPKPPPPPKPKSVTDFAFDFSRWFAWFVAKGTINQIVSGTKVAWSALSKKPPVAKQANNDLEVIEKALQEINMRKEIQTVQSIETNNIQKEKPTVQSIVNTVEVEKAVEKVSIYDQKLDDDADDFEVIEVGRRIIDTEKAQTLFDLDPSLDKEISDALLAAEEALASLEKDVEESGVTYAEIDLALQKAKLAAAKATKDAAELQAYLRLKRSK